VAEPFLEDWLQCRCDGDGASAGGGFAVADGERFAAGGGVVVGEGEGGGFADADAGVAQEGDQEAFLGAAGAGEQGVVFVGA